jgi:hypothetical protein
VELLLRLRNAAEHPDDGLAESAAAVAIVEVSRVIDAMEQWRRDPAWKEFQEAIQDPGNYLHAVTTLTVAAALKEHHSGTELVASGTPDRSPDLRMVVTHEHDLAVEVKTSLGLSNRAHAVPGSEALRAVERAIKHASTGFKGQLAAGKPGILVIGGFHIESETYAALGDAAGNVMASGRPRRNLLAIVISHLRFEQVSVAGGQYVRGDGPPDAHPDQSSVLGTVAFRRRMGVCLAAGAGAWRPGVGWRCGHLGVVWVAMSPSTGPSLRARAQVGERTGRPCPRAASARRWS